LHLTFVTLVLGEGTALSLLAVPQHIQGPEECQSLAW
jgi:hypothetical protein